MTDSVADSRSASRFTVNFTASKLAYQLLFLSTLVLGVFSNAQAGDFCSDAPYNGLFDGNVIASADLPTAITIDTDCTFQNFSASNPLTSTINFQTNDPAIYLIIFDNVVFSGNMACSSIDHNIWFVNGSQSDVSSSCQDLLIPAESIDKQSPATTASVGVPFTYTLTLPSMQFPLGDPSPNDLDNVILWDDISAVALGVDLTLISVNAYYFSSGTAVTLVQETDPLAKGGVWTPTNLSYEPIPLILSGEQIIVEIEVVLADTPLNATGTSFVNTAKWWFGRLIDGVSYDPLPGESGVSALMTIAEPNLVVNKTSDTTALNVGIAANFTIDVQNVGGSDAWNVTVLDLLPDGATAGMCDYDPTASVSAQIFKADGNPVGGLLIQGSHYTVTYTPAPVCELSIQMLGLIGIKPTEHLVIEYQSQLDLDTTGDGVLLTNIAGATQWSGANDIYPTRSYDRVLTNGTPLIVDHEDSNIITTALNGYYFQKTVSNVTSGASPSIIAAPGDKLRYRLRLFNVDENFTGINISDVLDPALFDTATFSFVSIAAGAAFDFVPTTGQLNIFGNGGFSLDLFAPVPGDPPAELIFEFEINLAPALVNGDVVPNQAFLSADNADGPVTFASDDPFLNGIAAPNVLGDVTSVLIQAPGPLSKTITQATATIGEPFKYTITIPETPIDVALYDVRVLDDLATTNHDLQFVSANVVSGGTWTLINTGTASSIVIEDAITGIDIPANSQAVIEITVLLLNSAYNLSPKSFINTADYTYNRANAVISTETAGEPGLSGSMQVVEPQIASITKLANNTTPTAGEVVRYSVTINASGGVGFSDVFDLTITDSLDAGLVYEGNPTVSVGAGVSADNSIVEPIITGDGSVATPQTLLWSLNNATADIDIVQGTAVTVSYDVRLLDSVLSNQTLSNSVVAQWTSVDGASSVERDGSGGANPLNDYITTAVVETVTTPAINATIIKDRTNDTYGAADTDVRIGDIVEYTLTLTIPEGTLGNLEVIDTLPQGLGFEEIVSINGIAPAPYIAVAPFSHADITAANAVVVGDPALGTSTVTWSFGDVSNLPNGGSSDNFLIVYRARVLNNVFTQTPTAQPLNNTVSINYDTATVPVTNTDLITPINLNQPVLTVAKSAAAAGGDTVIEANELVTYTVDVFNSGSSPAYDAVLQDIIPLGMRNGAASVTMVSTQLIVAGTVLANPTPSYNAVSGLLIWNLDNGVADSYTIPSGETLRIVYQVQADAILAGGLTLTNSAQITNYYSFDDEAVPTLATVTGTRQTYAASNIATTTLYTGALPTKALISPTTATIGEELVYQIRVPGTLSSSALYDLQINDTLDTNLEFVSATVTGGIGVTNNSTTAPSEMKIAIAQIPAGQQAVIELRARVKNVITAQQGVAINNTASYSYAYTAGGATQAVLSSTEIVTVTIIEPVITINRTVINSTSPGNPPTAGDVLRYSLNLTASGVGAGDNFSNAFDLSINDSLSLGLVYKAASSTVNGGINTITDPVTVGDGVSIAQSLSWNLAAATANIDVVEGSTVTVSYDLVVLDTVLANQILTNTVSAQWTGIDGTNVYERTGTAAPIINDYFTAPIVTSLATPDYTTLSKLRLSDTYGAADANLRIGDLVEYELRIGLQEGQHNNLILVDTLPQGLVFEAVVHINGDTSSAYNAIAPFVHNDITPVVSGNPVFGQSSITFTLGNVINAGDNNAANDEFVIVYRARVLDNVFTQTNSTTITNNARLDYNTAIGAVQLITSFSSTLLQPNLALSKIAVPAGGDTIIDAGELVTYTIDVVNSGSAPAYDVVIEDTIPFGMRNGAATISMMSTTLVNSATALSNPVPVYDAVTGIARWNLDSGVANAYTIAAGETLRLVYQVQADTDLSAGLTLSNQAVVTNYYSFDDEAVPVLGGVIGVRESYGPTNTVVVTLTSSLPGALLKQNPADLTVSVGETFSYQITVPATPVQTALHDVRIIDDLNVSSADLTYLSVSKISGSQAWTPLNTGTAKNLVIEDTSVGIDIPAGEQVIVEITVVVDNTATNVSGLLFNNTASYTYNQLANNAVSQQNGAAATTADMTIVGPDNITLEKVGPTEMRIGTSQTFTLNIHNTGTAAAWDLNIVDVLPNPTPGGMCDVAPSNISAQVFLADGVTAVSAPLVQDTDFVVNFLAEPSCTLTLTMQSATAAVGADNRLIVTYDAQLDTDNEHNIILTNIAAVTEWFSGDTAGAGATGAIRTYNRVLTNGTIDTLDHEDAHSIITELPIVSVLKSVVNLSTGQTPGSNASPSDTLRYSILIQNISPVELTNFSFVDELDALNTIPAFAADTINLITVPTDADTTNINGSGGVNNTGLLDIRNLNLGPVGSATDTVLLEFEATLAAVITSGTVVLNQAQLIAANLILSSDDPAINGADDPNLLGDEDPTETLITSAPLFEVYKTSEDITGDTAELMPGDTLRYTITVQNIGNENAINSILNDQIPANTTYVADSTTLNGLTVTDITAGSSPLENGMLINAPEDTTPGAMPADVSISVTNVATITFDVLISINVVEGAVISNQAFFNTDGAGSGFILENASDDPATATLDDPTLNVIGNQPSLDAIKTVSIVVDNGSPDSLDPGDVIRYSIIINNIGVSEATGVTFTDAVPANTTYVADSVTLNGLPVAQPDAGISPLITGIDVSSADLTPALPTAGNGIISAGASAVITFDVQVNAAVAVGTVISNQGSVDSIELPVELTDADGIDNNGDQPTLIVVGNAQLVSIIKSVSVVGGGPALAGGQLEYRISVTNISRVAATDIIITDNLDLPVPGQLTYVAGSGLLNGLATGVSYAAPVVTADYATTYANLLPGESAVLVFRASINNALAIGTTITNTADVSWNAATQSASANVSIDIGGTPGVGNISGTLWHDSNFDNIIDSGERPLSGWSIDVYRSGVLLGSQISDIDGLYNVNGLLPNNLGTDTYELVFRAPGSNTTTAMLGVADSPPAYIFTDGLQSIKSIVISSGGNLINLNLPVEPNGVVYDSILRTPISGATISLLNASTGIEVSSACFDDTAQQNQVTVNNGYYKFDLNFTQVDCISGSNYLIRITPPVTGYNLNPSLVITPQTDATTAALNVPSCPLTANDAITTTATICEAQASEFTPTVSAIAGSSATNYYLHLRLDGTVIPDDSQLFNNHLPIDPILSNAVTISKTTPLVNVVRSQLVPYTITVTNTLPVVLEDSNIIDSYPAGFKYVAGSARFNNIAMEPVNNNLTLQWSNIDLPINNTHTIKLLLIAGAAVNEGEYVNKAQVFDTRTNGVASGIAEATVRVIPDPAFDCSDVVGKIYDDKNLNTYQDKDEEGLVDIRVVTARGLHATTDKFGRFHITCAVVPNGSRGSNFIMKVDERSLPTGYRMTTENPRVQRATRGKVLKFNFGATIHKVVSMDLANDVFVTDSEHVHALWQPRLGLLMEHLKKSPSVLRLSYLADTESAGLVNNRLEQIKKEIIEKWEPLDKYRLVIETEIFWRRGSPSNRRGFN